MARKRSSGTSKRMLRHTRDLYGIYLEVFPTFPGVSLHVRYQYGDVLFRLEQFPAAAEQFERVRDSRPSTKQEQTLVRSAAEG